MLPLSADGKLIIANIYIFVASIPMIICNTIINEILFKTATNIQDMFCFLAPLPLRRFRIHQSLFMIYCGKICLESFPYCRPQPSYIIIVRRVKQSSPEFDVNNLAIIV